MARVPKPEHWSQQPEYPEDQCVCCPACRTTLGGMMYEEGDRLVCEACGHVIPLDPPDEAEGWDRLLADVGKAGAE